MKLAKKCLTVLFLGCIAFSATACGDKKNNSKPEEAAETTAAAPMFETAIATTSTAVTTETSATTTSETMTETSTTEETTQTSATTETTTTETTTATETTVTTTTTETTTVPVETAAETAPASEPAVTAQKFEPGIWWSTGSGGDRYFCFYDGNTDGSLEDQESGLNMGFHYDIENETTLTFHIGDAPSGERVSVSFTDGSTVVLTWENGISETLKYQGLGNFDTFRFYSNLELCEMALDYYEEKSGYRPGDAAAMVQPDGKIAVQLYDDMGDHTATSAWYTVDRFTAQGQDMMGNDISLKK